ncbi:MAG: hypothetical protein ACR2KT_07270 [Methylocella sp.]
MTALHRLSQQLCWRERLDDCVFISFFRGRSRSIDETYLYRPAKVRHKNSLQAFEDTILHEEFEGGSVFKTFNFGVDIAEPERGAP